MVKEEGDVSEVPERSIRLRWIGLGMAGLLLSECAGTLTDSENLRAPATEDGLHLFSRSTTTERSAWIASGLDAGRAEARRFAGGPKPPSLTICREGAAGCVSDEGWRAQTSQRWES